MKTTRFATLSLVVMLGAAFALAAEQQSQSPATAPAIISAGDHQALTDNIDKQAIVEGVVQDAKWSASGKVFQINFKDADESRFQGVIFSKNKDEMEKAFDGDLTKAFEGAKVQIKGKLQTFRDHPEIIIGKPEQLTVIEKPTAAAAAEAAPTTQKAGG